MVVYFKAIWSILSPFGIFCGHLVYFTAMVCCTMKKLTTLPVSTFYSTFTCYRVFFLSRNIIVHS
jgi:hypothetical protein